MKTPSRSQRLAPALIAVAFSGCGGHKEPIIVHPSTTVQYQATKEMNQEIAPGNIMTSFKAIRRFNSDGKGCKDIEFRFDKKFKDKNKMVLSLTLTPGVEDGKIIELNLEHVTNATVYKRWKLEVANDLAPGPLVKSFIWRFVTEPDLGATSPEQVGFFEDSDPALQKTQFDGQWVLSTSANQHIAATIAWDVYGKASGNKVEACEKEGR